VYPDAGEPTGMVRSYIIKDELGNLLTDRSPADERVAGTCDIGDSNRSKQKIPFHEHKHVHDLQSCKTLQNIFLRRCILSMSCGGFNPAWSPFQETRPYLGAYPSPGGFRAKKVCGHPTPAFHDSGSQNNENPPENQ